MHVTLAGFALYLHITVAIAAFMMAGVLHAALPAMVRARTVAEMRSWARVVHRLDPLFPVAALVLLALGAWLVHLEHGEGIRWSDGWVVTAVVSLVVIEGVAGALLAPTAKKLVADIEAAPEGAVPDDLRRRAADPKIWYVGHIATLGFASVVFLMAAKPVGWICPIIVAAGVAVGVLLSRLQLTALSATVSGAVPAPRAAADSAAVEPV
jgi:hypothetical protein